MRVLCLTRTAIAPTLPIRAGVVNGVLAASPA